MQVDPGAVRDFVATLSEGVPAPSPAGRSDAHAEAGAGGEGGDGGDGVVAVDRDDGSHAAAWRWTAPGSACCTDHAAGVRCVN